jgi:hypothetical protein
MSVNPSAFGPCPQFENTSGQPAVGDLLFFYNAGTTTKVNTFTSSTGATPNSNPIVLNSRGQPPNEIWWTNLTPYKMVWAPSTDTDPPTNPIRTFDNLYGINDTVNAVAAQGEWVLSASVPTFASGTSFTVPGNQTATLTIGRRLKTSNTSGIIYSTITNSVFGAVTTVTVTNDSGVLDSGLSVLSYGFLSSVNGSIPPTFVPNRALTADTATTANSLQSVCAFHAYRTTAQTSGTTCIFDGIYNQTGSAYSVSTGIFTAPVTGWYQFESSPYISNNTGGNASGAIYIVANGVNVGSLAVGVIPNGLSYTLKISKTCYLSSGQTAYISYPTTFTANLTLSAAAWCTFSGSLLSV